MSTLARPVAFFRRDSVVPVACLCAAALAAYCNSFGGPFVLDDLPSITDNPSLRPPWSLAAILSADPNAGSTVSGRPVVNLSLALNMAFGGHAVWGYHAVNLLIHALAGLLLFGLVRRTCELPALAVRWGAGAASLALAVAMLWTVHPLQTESVTYIIQRTESLAGLWYLLTLYAFVRGTTGTGGGRWLAVAVAACWLGMATKEVMATAPVIVLLYDRTFVAGSFVEAWRRRRGFHLALAASWLLVGSLAIATAGRGGTAGLGAGISVWSYALTQCAAIVRYLGLAFWPRPLVFDYGTEVAGGLGEVWLQAVAMLVLVAGTVWALWRRPVWGFLGAWFLLILAPSSSLVPVATQTVAEHRMYLPLAVPVLCVVLGLQRLSSRWWLPLCGLLALGAGGLTFQRNADYRTAERLWADTVAKQPANGRAHHELGRAIYESGRVEEAMAHYQSAIRLLPTAAEPRNNLGLAFAYLGRRAEAMEQYGEALRLRPRFVDALNNLGLTLLAEGRLDEAEVRFRDAIRVWPGYAAGYSNLASVLLEKKDPAAAIGPAREAVRLDPADAMARCHLGNALAETQQWPAAAAEYEAALRLQPDFPEVHNNFGNVELMLRRESEAIGHYEEALRLRPDYVEPRRNLAHVLTQMNRPAEAIQHFEILARLRPADAEIRDALERLRAEIRR